MRPFGNVIYLTPAFTMMPDELKILTDAVVKVVGRAETLKADRAAVQIIFVGALDLHRGDLADAQGTSACDIDRAVDLRRVGHGAALGDARADFVDDDLLTRADFALADAAWKLSAAPA